MIMYSQLCSFLFLLGFLCFIQYMYSTYVFNTWVARISGASPPWVLTVTPYKCFSYVVMICACVLASVWLWQTSRDVVLVLRSTSVSSRLRLHKEMTMSQLFTCRAQDVTFDQIVQATLIQWAKSVVAIYGSVNPNTANRLMRYLLAEVSSWWRHGFDVFIWRTCSVAYFNVAWPTNVSCRLVRPTSRSCALTSRASRLIWYDLRYTY